MDQQEMMLKLILTAWNGQITAAGKLFNGLTDDELDYEVAPNRNTGVYLLGHLTAVHDNLFTLLGLGERLYPELDQVFIFSPCKSGKARPVTNELRNYWNSVNEKLAGYFNRLSVDEWLQKHTNVSDEDIAKEPHRNRLNVLLSRTNHLANHIGQLTFLKK